MAKKLSNQISISELMTMRESGMSNKDIASSLDVSYSYVVKAIGPQPAELTTKAKSDGVKNYHARKAAAKAASQAVVNVIASSVEEIVKESAEIAKSDAGKVAIKPHFKSGVRIVASTPAKYAAHKTFRKVARTQKARPAAQPVVQNAAKPASALKIASHVVNFEGGAANYRLNATEQTVQIRTIDAQTFILNVKQIPCFIAELAEIHQNASSKKAFAGRW